MPTWVYTGYLLHVGLYLISMQLISRTTFWCSIVRPHRTAYVDAAFCYRRSSVVCLSVCLLRSLTLHKLLNGSRCIGLWTRVRRNNHLLGGDQIPHEKGKFKGGGRPIVKYWEYRPYAAAMQHSVELLSAKLLWPLIDCCDKDISSFVFKNKFVWEHVRITY